jgi:prepilin-type N-terminal cleavage/methylation domain-containing protein
MSHLPTVGARLALGRAWVRARPAAEGEAGFTLTELLVVMAILGVVLAGLTTLFTSAVKSQTDQTNRTQAQQDARLGLDKLRREIHCASNVTTPSGYPASLITITLGSYCPTAGGAAATLTWCTKPAASGGQPYTLWRYTGSACSGTGTKWASDLVDKVADTTPAITAGQIFNVVRVPAATLTPASSGGTLLADTYSYVVTALVSGVEVPGTAASATVASGLTNKVTVSWTAYAGAGSYNVYGRGAGGLRFLKNVTSGTTYVDTGPTKLTDNPLTLPNATINVADTSTFNAGANTIAFGASGPVPCTGTTSTSFTGCTGGQAGKYPQGMPVDSASTARPPRSTLSVSLALDKTLASTSQRFVLLDNIVLRNS